jgi:hypothetical protein
LPGRLESEPFVRRLDRGKIWDMGPVDFWAFDSMKRGPIPQILRAIPRQGR